MLILLLLLLREKWNVSKEKVVPPTLLETTVVQYFVRVITNPALSTESIIDVIGILIPSPKYFHHIHIPSYRFVPSPIDCCVRVRGITSTINPIRTKRSTLESYIVIYDPTMDRDHIKRSNWLYRRPLLFFHPPRFEEWCCAETTDNFRLYSPTQSIFVGLSPTLILWMHINSRLKKTSTLVELHILLDNNLHRNVLNSPSPLWTSILIITQDWTSSSQLITS